MAKKQKPEDDVQEEVGEAAPDLNMGTELGTHIVVDGGVVDAPAGYANDYRLNVGGRNVEHTHDLPNGVWCYTTKP